MSKSSNEDKNASHQNTVARLGELRNVNRIVSNAFNLINDVDIKGAHANATAEILGWLNGFMQSIQGQITALESTLPKSEDTNSQKAEDQVKAPKAVEAVPTEASVK